MGYTLRREREQQVARRLVLLSKRQAIDEQVEQGNVTPEAAASLKDHIKKSLAAMRDR